MFKVDKILFCNNSLSGISGKNFSKEKTFVIRFVICCPYSNIYHSDPLCVEALMSLRIDNSWFLHCGLVWLLHLIPIILRITPSCYDIDIALLYL